MKKGFLTGLLLFGIFFGAGNLIFPPTLGYSSGENFVPAIIGFVISGVGLAIVTLIVGTLNPKGYAAEMDEKFSPLFSTSFLVVLYLTIGPFFAIPRTAATSFSIGVEPILKGNVSLWLFVFTLIYFACAYLIAINPTKVLGSVGKVLTPMFTILIIVLIVVGIVKYGGNTPSVADATYQGGKAFGTGFIEGYNTLDALAAVAFCIVAMSTLKQLGFKSKKEFLSSVAVAGLVAAVGFTVLYVGLGLLGNKFQIPAEILADAKVNKGAYILSAASKDLFGGVGQLFLGVMVILTCFTTTVGLIVATSEFFVEKFPKYSYKVYATIFTAIGFGVANGGLQTVIQYSVPVLLLLYPMVMCILLIVIVNKYVALSKLGMQLTIGVVTIISILSVVGSTFKVVAINNLLAKLPLAEQSLQWLLPAVVLILLSLVLPGKQKGKSYDFNEL